MIYYKGFGIMYKSMVDKYVVYDGNYSRLGPEMDLTDAYNYIDLIHLGVIPQDWWLKKQLYLKPVRTPHEKRMLINELSRV